MKTWILIPFKEAADGMDAWYQKELENQGYDDAADLIAAFTSDDESASIGTYDVEDHSDLGWNEQTELYLLHH